MIVCQCHGVTDRDVLAARAGGARTPAQLARASAAGTGCGGCRPTIRTLLAPVAVCGRARRVTLAGAGDGRPAA